MALKATVKTLRTLSWGEWVGGGAKKSKDPRLEFDRRMAGFRWEMAEGCGAELQGSGNSEGSPDAPSRLMDSRGDGRGVG